MNSIILVPEKVEGINSEQVRRCTITRMDDNVQIDQRQLWFQFSNKIVPPEDSDCDSYLLAIVMDAMAEGRSIIVKGSVSKQLLSNLVEYQSIWNKWLPDVYRLIEISVDSIREKDEQVAGAICAFSGGVDATFSVWRHTQKKNSYRTQTINLCAFVQGFDIPLTDDNAFYSAKKRAEETLNDVGLSLESIKTNFKEVSSASWEHSFGAALVSTLSNFKSVAGTCIFGSSEPYDSLVIPWGSNPISDHLLSSDQFIVLHDGASHSRIEKVNEIAEWNKGVNNLRVCWQGDLKDRNCGQCEKCMRTKFNFIVTGNTIPSCFPESDVDGLNIDNLTITNIAVRAEWVQLLDYAKRKNIKQAWVTQLDKIINEKRFIDIIFPEGSLRRKQIRKIKALGKKIVK